MVGDGTRPISLKRCERRDARGFVFSLSFASERGRPGRQGQTAR